MLFLDENSIPYSPVPLKTPESMAPAESIAPDLFPAGTSASVSAGTANDISCRLCPRQCRILPERYGVCRVRKNTKNKIIPVTYGYPVKWKRLTADLLPWHFTDPETRIAAIAGFGCPLACKDCHDSVLSAKGFFKKGVSWHYYRPEL